MRNIAKITVLSGIGYYLYRKYIAENKANNEVHYTDLPKKKPMVHASSLVDGIYNDLPRVENAIANMTICKSPINLDLFNPFWKQAVYYLDDINCISDSRIKEDVTIIRNLLAKHIADTRQSVMMYDLRIAEPFRKLIRDAYFTFDDPAQIKSDNLPADISIINKFKKDIVNSNPRCGFIRL